MATQSYLVLLLDQLTDLRVREKVLRLTQYAALAAGSWLPLHRTRLEKLSVDIALGRMVFRLLEDLPKLRQTVTAYHAGPDKSAGVVPFTWLLATLGNVCDCLYFPAEQVAWCLQTGPKASYYKTLATKLWVLSLFFSILRCLLTMHQLNKGTSGMTDRVRTNLYQQQILSLITCSADICNGVTFLNVQSSSKRQIGVLGIISSALGLHSVLKAKRQQQLRSLQDGRAVEDRNQQ